MKSLKKVLVLLIAGGLGLLLLFLAKRGPFSVTDPTLLTKSPSSHSTSSPGIDPAIDPSVASSPQTNSNIEEGHFQLPTPIRVLSSTQNYNEIKESFERKHSDKKFTLSKSFNSVWGNLRGDKLSDYQGMPIAEASAKFLEDHPELLSDLPAGSEVSSFEIKKTPSGYNVMVAANYEDKNLPGNKVLYFQEKEGKAHDLYEVKNSTPPIETVYRCNNVDESQAREFINRHHGQSVAFKRIAKEWNGGSASSISDAWVLDYSLKTPEGPTQSYLAKVSACELRFSDSGHPRVTDQH